MEYIKYTVDGDTMFIELKGHIDSANAPAVEKEINEAIDREAMDKLVLDAQDLEHISSAGLRVLLQVGTRYDQPLDIVDVSPMVMEILETTGFTQIMNIYPAK